VGYGDFSSAVGANVADSDPDETPRRLGSALPAAKSADRVLNGDETDLGSQVPRIGGD
jgi:hypothetical protein